MYTVPGQNCPITWSADSDRKAARYTRRRATRLWACYRKPEDLIGGNGGGQQLPQILVERVGKPRLPNTSVNKPPTTANSTGSTRHGKRQKMLKDALGVGPIEISRDRQGSFEPPLMLWLQPPGPALTTRCYRAMPERHASQFSCPVVCHPSRMAIEVNTGSANRPLVVNVDTSQVHS